MGATQGFKIGHRVDIISKEITYTKQANSNYGLD